jgi:ADP-L-glycero-D-manno-heptose 6-epimerase
MIIITGGLGFIGSNILAKFNKLKKKNIIIVDSYSKEKFKNITNLNYTDYFDKKEFIHSLIKNKFKNITCIFHQGACTNTQEANIDYLLENNFEYSKKILHHCSNNNVKLVYASSASVYGNTKNNLMVEHNYKINTKNLYAYSKFLFDKYVLNNKKKLKNVIGLRYFNVYGNNEYHKLNMCSPVLSFYKQLRKNNYCNIFGEYGGFKEGMHSRDFVYIDDVVNINIWAAKKKIVDIINVGTGFSTSFKDVALKIINKLGKGKIKYVSFPKKFKGKYQVYTKAEIKKLRCYGYKDQITNIDNGISLYLKKINEKSIYSNW